MDGQPISSSKNLLLVATARSANTGMIWNEKRTSLSDWGSAPTVIEPVRGKVVLRNIEPLQRIEIIPLDGAGKALGNSISAHAVKADFVLQIGQPATVWHLVEIQR